MKQLTFIVLVFFFIAVMRIDSHAEVKVIESEGIYLMGDNDSKVDARRIAIQEAKRKAIESAGTFIASLTEIKSFELTKDEITAYTAGVIESEVVSEEMRGTAARPEIYIKLRCKIDTDVLMDQINSYRENRELQQQLEESVRQSEALRKERDELLRQLAEEKDKSRAEETRKRLDAVLANQESIDDTNRMWTGLSPRIGGAWVRKDTPPPDATEMDRAFKVLENAVRINPENMRARLLLASIYKQRNDPESAERELRHILSRDPSNIYFRLQLGELLKDQRRFKDALREFQFVEQMQPDEPRMLFMTGMTFRALRNCRMTVDYLKRFMDSTRGINRPQLAILKQRAVEVLKECGGRRHLPERVRQKQPGPTR